MPRYAPLPAVSIDPRSEAQLVNQAAKRTYDASNAKLNDFSAGNPLMALLEGQAFAQAEFLFWANQLPESILIEWIGPFLGAMRRLGTPSLTRLTVQIAPNDFQVTIPAGSSFTTNSNLTNGESIEFVTTEDLVFPAKESVGYIPAVSSVVGAFTNVAANSITQASSLAAQVTSVTNPLPAVGGSDIETLDQTKERFFTLIRRRNPVSSQDWQDLFTDLFGVGTFTSVLPNRSSQISYSWLNDYIKANGHISFFFLNPDGTEPTPEQIARAQNVVNFSLPIEMTGHVYGINLSPVQYDITLAYDPAADYAGMLRNYSMQVRDNLFNILTPGKTFPSGYDPSVADVDSALLETFPPATKYSEPDILAATAYNTPLGVSEVTLQNAQAYEFQRQTVSYAVNDLLMIGDPDSVNTEAGWPVIKGYTPYSSEKAAQVSYQNLVIKQIRAWGAGIFAQGDVIRVPTPENALMVALKNFENTDPNADPNLYIQDGLLSAPKDFIPWVPGISYNATDPANNYYDPDLIEFDQELVDSSICERKYFEPPGDDNLSYRVNWFVYVANQNFTLEPSSNTTTGAQSQDYVAYNPVSVPYLKAGGTYPAGTWIRTPSFGGGPDAEIDPYYYYVDIRRGVVVRYAYVNNTFTFVPAADRPLAESFSQLIEAGTITSVRAANGEASQPLFQYEPRFPPQTYLSFQVTANSPVEYYFTLQGMTPSSDNPSQMVKEGSLLRIDTSASLREAYLAAILPNAKTGKSNVCPPLDMFVFSPGNTTLFRRGSEVVSYIATQHFSPAFAPGVYIANGLLIEGNDVNQKAISFYDVNGDRPNENFVVTAEDSSVYRVMRYFNASEEVFNWDGLPVQNTPRLMELAGNLLRVVQAYTCEEPIVAPDGNNTSGIKLGVAQITLRSKAALGSQSTFIWEGTEFASEVPQLSYATDAKEVYKPVEYGHGTLAL